MISFHLDWVLIIQILVSTVLPILVGLVTKRLTHPGVKAIVLAVISLVSSLLFQIGQALSTHTNYDAGQGLLLALPTFLIAVAMHYGLWKPTGVADAAQSLFTKDTIVVHESSPTSQAEASPEQNADIRRGTSGRS